MLTPDLEHFLNILRIQFEQENELKDRTAVLENENEIIKDKMRRIGKILMEEKDEWN